MLACLSSQQPAANPQRGRRGFGSLCACSPLFVYILNETASEEFALTALPAWLHAEPCCAPLAALTARASEGKARRRLGKAERHCALHQECLWGRWWGFWGWRGVICRERRSVKRWLMKGKARRQESSFLPLNLSSESSSNTSLLEQTRTKS